jgi:hypothetical protein
MARGVVDLIQENKRRFYAGEIRNSFYKESYNANPKSGDAVVVDHRESNTAQTSIWKSLKIYGQKFSDDLFYEPVK